MDMLCALVFTSALAVGVGGVPSSCDPEPVVKSVESVWYEIKVPLIGETRMDGFAPGRRDVQSVFDYWQEAMGREIGDDDGKLIDVNSGHSLIATSKAVSYVVTVPAHATKLVKMRPVDCPKCP